MSANTKIEWADHTFNPWTGCTKVSPACDHCYAESWSKRAGDRVGKWGPGAPRVRTSHANWRLPLKWNAEAERLGVRYRVFCASLADVFDNDAPREWRDDLFRLILDTPHLDWLLLTKRISNVSKMLTKDQWDHLGNVWLGATICNQEEADRDIPKLLRVPAAKRFLSIEPLLGSVDLKLMQYEHSGEFAPDGREYVNTRRRSIRWVIVGGESGHGARPMHPDWARSLRDQCQAAGVSFFFKQWGEHVGGELQPNPDYPDSADAWRIDPRGERWHDPSEAVRSPSAWEPVKFIKVGKKCAGRLLDGREWNEVPA